MKSSVGVLLLLGLLLQGIYANDENGHCVKSTDKCDTEKFGSVPCVFFHCKKDGDACGAKNKDSAACSVPGTSKLNKSDEGEKGGKKEGFKDKMKKKFGKGQ